MLLCPEENQPAHDLVMTPAALARLIIDHFQPSGRMLDPCRGKGAFYNALKQRNPETEWCEINEGRDFLDHEAEWRRRHYEWVISTPPWSKLRQFLVASMQVSDNIVFLATITQFVTRARLREIHGAGFGIRKILLVDQPPPPWPSSGFQLAAVHIQRGFVSSMFTDGQSASRTALQLAA